MSAAHHLASRREGTKASPWTVLAATARMVSGASVVTVIRTEAGFLDVAAVDGGGSDWRQASAVALEPGELMRSLGVNVAEGRIPAALRSAWPWLPGAEPFAAVPVLGEDAGLLGVVLLFGRPGRANVRRVEDLAALAAASIEQVERRGRFEALLNSGHAVAWEARLPDLQVTGVSGRYADLLGYGQDEWLAPEFFARMIDPRDRERVFSACMAEIARGRDHELVYRAVRADGDVIWLRDFTRVVHDETGRAVSLSGLFIDISARKEADLALERRQQRMRVATEAAPVVTWEWDVESGRVEADVRNAPGPETLASERLHIREMLTRLHADDRDAWWRAANQAIATGQPFRALVRRAGAEDHELWLVVLAHPAEVDPATGRVRRFVVASIDVTDHRRAQVDAALWRERVLHVCESLNEALAEWDIASDRMDWLHAPNGVLGQPVAGLRRSADLLQFVHPDDLPAAHAAVIDCLRHGPYWHCSLRWRVPGGGYRWLSGQGFMRRNEAGRATHVVGIVYDDDELQRTLEQQALQSAMLDRLGEPVIALDDQQRIVVANRALESLLGVDSGALIGRPVMDLVQRRHQAELLKVIQDLRAVPGASGGLRHRLVMHRPDGQDAAAELSFGRVDIRWRTYWVGVGHDVTQSQQQRRRIMEAVVSEQQRLAIELHDGLSQELTGLSLLLSAIASRVAQHKPIEEDLERAAGLVASAIETTRDVSHGLSAHRVAQGGLARALESLAAATGRRTAVHCETDIDGAVSRLIDVPVAHQLARIAQEAVTNAVRHGRPDEIRIELGMCDGRGRLSITDNGRGIDRTEPSREGMGLQVLHYRADIIGGDLAVEPQEGGGTRVSCVFPLDHHEGSGA